MRPLLLIRNPARSGFQADDYASDFSARRASKGERRFAGEIPMPRPFGMAGDDASTPCGKEGFFQGLSAEAQSDFASLATRFQCPGSTVLISEAEKPSGVLFLLEGEVNISMNSSDGRRLLLGVRVRRFSRAGFCHFRRVLGDPGAGDLPVQHRVDASKGLSRVSFASSDRR